MVGRGHHSQPCWPLGRLRTQKPAFQPHPGKSSHASALVSLSAEPEVMPASREGWRAQTPPGPTQKEQHTELCEWGGTGRTWWHLQLRSARLTSPQGTAQAIGLARTRKTALLPPCGSLPQQQAFFLESSPHTPPSQHRGPQVILGGDTEAWMPHSPVSCGPNSPLVLEGNKTPWVTRGPTKAHHKLQGHLECAEGPARRGPTQARLSPPAPQPCRRTDPPAKPQEPHHLPTKKTPGPASDSDL